MKICYLIIALLSACATYPARPAAWAGFRGLAYLPPASTHRPPQHVLYSLARAARLDTAHLRAK